jgi:hypothetical protein
LLRSAIDPTTARTLTPVEANLDPHRTQTPNDDVAAEPARAEPHVGVS